MNHTQMWFITLIFQLVEATDVQETIWKPIFYCFSHLNVIENIDHNCVHEKNKSCSWWFTNIMAFSNAQQ